ATARPCCPACRRTADADVPPAQRRATSRSPVRRPRTLFFPPDPRSARAGWRHASDSKSFDDAAVQEVLLDDFVDVGAVDVGIPDRLRIDHDAGPLLAAIEAARLVDAHLALACETERLH